MPGPIGHANSELKQLIGDLRSRGYNEKVSVLGVINNE